MTWTCFLGSDCLLFSSAGVMGFVRYADQLAFGVFHPFCVNIAGNVWR